jgi:hypothetical protein
MCVLARVPQLQVKVAASRLGTQRASPLRALSARACRAARDAREHARARACALMMQQSVYTHM